jgi:hypothetical protein
MSGTAVKGSQYTLSATQFTIPAGATSATLRLTVINGPAVPKIATMTLTSGTGYTLSPSHSSSVSIRK